MNKGAVRQNQKKRSSRMAKVGKTPIWLCLGMWRPMGRNLSSNSFCSLYFRCIPVLSDDPQADTTTQRNGSYVALTASVFRCNGKAILHEALTRRPPRCLESSATGMNTFRLRCMPRGKGVYTRVIPLMEPSDVVLTCAY